MTQQKKSATDKRLSAKERRALKIGVETNMMRCSRLIREFLMELEDEFNAACDANGVRSQAVLDRHKALWGDSMVAVLLKLTQMLHKHKDLIDEDSLHNQLLPPMLQQREWENNRSEIDAQLRYLEAAKARLEAQEKQET